MQIRKSIQSLLLFYCCLKKFNFSKEKNTYRSTLRTKIFDAKTRGAVSPHGCWACSSPCRCAQACKSAALHCTATQGGRWFYGEDKRIGGSEMQRLPRPEGKAGNVWLAWHGSRGVRRGVWLPATAAAGCRRRRVSRGGGVEGLRRRSLPRPMGTGKQSRQRDMNARTTTSTRPAGSGRGATPGS